MENYTIVLIVMAVMILASAFASKLKLPVPVILILVGICIGFFPYMPEIELSPEIVMLLFLPPLLYDAAFNISAKDFKTNINTISTLAIGLVFITTIGIAVVAYLLIPDISWPVAFVLGAILSATDAVAAIGLTKGLGLSHKTITILEGESLVNDASALVAYHFAVAAVTGVAFVWWKAGIDFVIVLGGGFLIGFIISRSVGFFLRLFRGNDMVIIGLMLLMPFVTYLVAEHFQVSGVIAVVVLGLSMSWLSRERFPDNIKQQSRSFWDVNIFLLNGLIFVLLGIQFPLVLKKIPEDKIGAYFVYAVIIALVALGIRAARVFAQQVNLDKAFQGKRKRKISEEALFDSKTSLIISWAGMRGIVSLAIALGLPTHLKNGQPFPLREEVIFISIVVVLFSILVQGLSLPWLVKRITKSENAT